MYGDGLIYIKNIDIWKGKLRLTVLDTVEKSEMYIFMTHDKAHELAIDLMNSAMELVTRELVDKISNLPVSKQKDIEFDSDIVSLDSFRER